MNRYFKFGLPVVAILGTLAWLGLSSTGESWTRQSLPEGMEIVVDGYQAKDGAMRAIGRDITFADGKNLFMGSCGLEAPDAITSAPVHPR